MPTKTKSEAIARAKAQIYHDMPSMEILCPWCGNGVVHKRTYQSSFGKGKIDFAACDNFECNVEWLAKDTTTYWSVIDALARHEQITLSPELIARRKA